jgi:hypothetical protein
MTSRSQPLRPLTGPLRSNRVLRHLRRGSRAKRQARRWPAVVLWLLGLAVGAAALIGLAHLHGDPPAKNGDFPDPALATLAETGVALFAACGLIVFMTWCIRGIRLEFLSWWPGRIVVHTFEADDQEVPAPERERLTAGFRDRLGMSHLQTPAPTPAPAEQGAFLDVLAGAQLDLQNPLASLVGLLRAASPGHAYEVRGSLATGEGPRDKGVTVHVVRLPGKGAGGHTVWDTSWDGAMRQAADHAAASILPRTRVCRSPWAGWRRYYLPTTLFEAYERAAELEHERRYDEALHLYLKAVGEDPKNLALRLQLGFLQEKLALYLDALDTYQSILQIARAETLDDATADGANLRRPARLAARRERKRAERVTRYRRAVLLGGGELARQWGKWGPRAKTRRDKERDRLRERLEPGLERLFKAALGSRAVKEKAYPIYDVADRDPPSEGSCAAALWKPASAGEQGTTDDMEQLLLWASLHELDSLRRHLPAFPIRRTSLTRATVEVSSLVVESRLRWVLNGKRCPKDLPWDEYLKKANAGLDQIEKGREFDRWQEHYNAACIYALPLLATDNPPPDRAAERLTAHAVRRLELAVEKADSAYLASRRDWLVSEDPDLRGLRNQPRFKRFEAAYLPSPARAPRRPVSVHKWEVSRYTLALLRATARRWEDEWERRRTQLNGDGDVRTLLRWSRDEARAWRLMREVAVNHRDWDTRHKLLDQMRDWTAEYGFEPMRVPFPRFSAGDEAQLRGKEPEGLGKDLERAAVTAIKDKDLRLKALGRLLDKAGDEKSGGRFMLGRELKSIRGDLGRLEAGGHELKAARVTRLCGAQANLWRRAGALLEPDEDRKAAQGDLSAALVAGKEAWRRLPGKNGPRASHANGGPPEAVPSAA